MRRFDNEGAQAAQRGATAEDVEIKVGYLAAELAATKLAAGLGPRRPLAEASGQPGQRRGRIEAAANELDTYVELIYGRWLLRHNQQRKPRQVLSRLKQAKSEAR